MFQFPLLEQLSREWHSSQRLQTGVHVITLIVMLNALLYITDEISLTKGDCKQLFRQTTRLNVEATETHWMLDAQSSKVDLVSAESRLRQAETTGLARAEAKTWLENILRHNKISDFRLIVNDAVQVADFDTVYVVSASIKAPFEYVGLFNSLWEFENRQNFNNVFSLEVAGKKTHFSIIIKLYYQISQP